MVVLLDLVQHLFPGLDVGYLFPVEVGKQSGHSLMAVRTVGGLPFHHSIFFQAFHPGSVNPERCPGSELSCTDVTEETFATEHMSAVGQHLQLDDVQADGAGPVVIVDPGWEFHGCQ